MCNPVLHVKTQKSIHIFVQTKTNREPSRQRQFVFVTKSFIVIKQKGIPQHNQSNQTIHEKPMHQKIHKGIDQKVQRRREVSDFATFLHWMP